MVTGQQTPFPARERRVLIGASGSAAVMMLPMYVGALRDALGGTYTVVMTHTAATFLPPHTVELVAERVVSDAAPSPGGRSGGRRTALLKTA
jgi:hypothetical protein